MVEVILILHAVILTISLACERTSILLNFSNCRGEIGIFGLKILHPRKQKLETLSVAKELVDLLLPLTCCIIRYLVEPLF